MREDDRAPDEAELLALRATVIMVTPDEAGQKIKELAGRETELGPAKTIFPNGENGNVVILIDSTMAPWLQEVLLVHETAQLWSIRSHVASGNSIAGILPHAHFIGLRAGIRCAEILGYKEEYLRIREEWDRESERKLHEYYKTHHIALSSEY